MDILKLFHSIVKQNYSCYISIVLQDRSVQPIAFLFYVKWFIEQIPLFGNAWIDAYIDIYVRYVGL